MIYTGYELFWLFFIYSFVGWCAEAAFAAVMRHRFVNRGFVNGPLCPIYGTGAVAFAIFLPGLLEHLFFLFLGGMILASFIEYITGRLLEHIFHRKWWDYSGERFHVEGYICLKSSVLWGGCAVVMMLFVNPLLRGVISWIPLWIGWICIWVLTGLLIIDGIGSTLAVMNLHQKAVRIEAITAELQRTSKLLENALTQRIQRRMVNAFPNIGLDKVDASKLKRQKAQVFAEGCGFYKLVSLFFVGAFLGDLVETVFCWITTGRLMSRSSVVYGPFSIVWGLGCALLSAVLYRYKDRNDRYIFFCGTVLGGAYEYICSVFTELVFGTVFWDYSDFAFNLGGRINLLFCFFWGVAAVVWIKGIYPWLSQWIEKLPMKAGKILCHFMIVFMVLNILVSTLALSRYTERNAGNAPKTEIDRLLDDHFPDERMERIYPNAIIKEAE